MQELAAESRQALLKGLEQVSLMGIHHASTGQMELQVQSLSAEPYFSLSVEGTWTCEALKQEASRKFQELALEGALKAVFYEGQALAGERSLQELGLVHGSVVTAVLGPLTFAQPVHCDPSISVEEGRWLRLGRERTVLYPAICGPQLKLGQVHYFEVKLVDKGRFGGQYCSLRVGLCRKIPEHFLGKDEESWSFWFDDGDAYNAGRRFHAGQLGVHVPMGQGDSVGVLADLREPKPLEFVLNRRSTGPCRHSSTCYGDPIFPCVSFCNNHPGCTVEVTHLGAPPEDLLPFPGDANDPRPFQREPA